MPWLMSHICEKCRMGYSICFEQESSPGSHAEYWAACPECGHRCVVEPRAVNFVEGRPEAVVMAERVRGGAGR